MSKRAHSRNNGNEQKKEKPKITVRPTDGELKLLHARAASFGYKSLSKYLIERGLKDGAMIQTPDRERLERLLFEVRKIGVNINQIAHQVNAGNLGYSQQYLDRAMRDARARDERDRAGVQAMSGGAFVTVSVGRSGTAAANVRYMTRARATEGEQERLWTQNIPEHADHPDHAERGMSYKERTADLREHARADA